MCRVYSVRDPIRIMQADERRNSNNQHMKNLSHNHLGNKKEHHFIFPFCSSTEFKRPSGIPCSSGCLSSMERAFCLFHAAYLFLLSPLLLLWSNFKFNFDERGTFLEGMKLLSSVTHTHTILTHVLVMCAFEAHMPVFAVCAFELHCFSQLPQLQGAHDNKFT